MKINFSNQNTYDEYKGGFGVHELIVPFNDTFYKSSYPFFKQFILNPSNNSSVNKIILDIERRNNSGPFIFSKPHFQIPENLLFKKWFIISDYAFGDKPQNVVSFVIMPYAIDFEILKSTINNIQPTDIKKTSRVSGDFIDLLNNYPILSISIVLNKDLKLFTKEKDYLLQKLDGYIKMIKYWMEKEPCKKPKYEKQINSLCKLKRLISQGYSLKFMRQIEIVSALTSYLMAEITKLIPGIKLIGWFPDRDPLLSYKEKELDISVTRDFVQSAYHVLCIMERCNKAKIVFAIPENSGLMWYDELIRLPDYIAGALADYDMVNNKCSHDKFIPIIEKVFTNERRHLFFKLQIDMKDSASMECVRLNFSSQNNADKS